MTALKKYLTTEIGIEFKSALYFFAILFFYCVYQIANGHYEVRIIIMAEIITTAYIMGYIQVLCLRNFEETERIGTYEVFATIGCSLVYGLVSFLCNWFERDWKMTVGYFVYMVFAYFCMIGVYYAKRHIDTEMLNNDLEAFKKREGKNGEKETDYKD